MFQKSRVKSVRETQQSLYVKTHFGEWIRKNTGYSATSK